MRYKGKDIEILGKKEILGQSIVWIRLLETNEFLQINAEDIEEVNESFSLNHISLFHLLPR
jgi:hypothetical protein